MEIKNKTDVSLLPSFYILPSNDSELQDFSKNFKSDMMNQIVNVIEFAVNNNLPFVEVFQFKNSNFVITLSKKDYLSNLDNIYSYYMEKEIYEGCSKVIFLQNVLKNIKCLNKNSTNNTNEKQTTGQ